MTCQMLLAAIAFGVITLTISGCGGGGEQPALVYSMHGDSLTSGHHTTGRLSVPPARAINELANGRFTVLDYSQPGATTHDSLVGSPTMPAGPFAEFVSGTIAQTVILRLGAADAVLGVPLASTEADLREHVRLALQAGRGVVLVGAIQHPVYGAAFAALDAVTQRIATDNGLPFVSLADIPVTAADLIDHIHPNDSTSAAHSARIAQALLERN